MMQIPNILRIRCGVIDSRRAHKERDQPPIPRIEIQMQFLGYIQIRLLEHERHTQHTLIEIDDRLTVGSYKRDVMNALRLYFGHRYFSIGLETLKVSLITIETGFVEVLLQIYYEICQKSL